MKVNKHKSWLWRATLALMTSAGRFTYRLTDEEGWIKTWDVILNLFVVYTRISVGLRSRNSVIKACYGCVQPEIQLQWEGIDKNKGKTTTGSYAWKRINCSNLTWRAGKVIRSECTRNAELVHALVDAGHWCLGNDVCSTGGRISKIVKMKF